MNPEPSLAPNGALPSDHMDIEPQLGCNGVTANTQLSRQHSQPVHPSQINPGPTQNDSAPAVPDFEVEPAGIVPYIDVVLGKLALPDDLELCLLCGSSGDSTHFIFCRDCGEAYHTFCLSPPVVKADLFPSAEDWQCPSCKCCATCADVHSEDMLIVCDKCDRCFHIFCLQPPLEAIPTEDWRCKDCTECVNCKRKPKNQAENLDWTHDNTLCRDCNKLYLAKFDDVMQNLNIRTAQLNRLKRKPKFLLQRSHESHSTPNLLADAGISSLSSSQTIETPERAALPPPREAVQPPPAVPAPAPVPAPALPNLIPVKAEEFHAAPIHPHGPFSTFLSPAMPTFQSEIHELFPGEDINLLRMQPFGADPMHIDAHPQPPHLLTHQPTVVAIATQSMSQVFVGAYSLQDSSAPAAGTPPRRGPGRLPKNATPYAKPDIYLGLEDVPADGQDLDGPYGLRRKRERPFDHTLEDDEEYEDHQPKKRTLPSPSGSQDNSSGESSAKRKAGRPRKYPPGLTLSQIKALQAEGKLPPPAKYKKTKDREYSQQERLAGHLFISRSHSQIGDDNSNARMHFMQAIEASGADIPASGPPTPYASFGPSQAPNGIYTPPIVAPIAPISPPKPRPIAPANVHSSPNLFTSSDALNASFGEEPDVEVAPFAANLTVSQIEALADFIRHGEVMTHVFALDRVATDFFTVEDLKRVEKSRKTGLSASNYSSQPLTKSVYSLIEPDAIVRSQTTDPRTCALCGAAGNLPLRGRLLSVDVDCWVHLNCALWAAEVYETDGGNVYNVQKAVKRGTLTTCTYCKSQGATVNCNIKGCRQVYHLHCAIQANCKLASDDVSNVVLCESHARQSAKELEPVPTSVFMGTNRLLCVARPSARRYRALLPTEKLRLGALTVQAFGKVNSVPGVQFNSKQRIFAVGYTAIRRFWSPSGGRSTYKLFIAAQDENSTRPTFTIESSAYPNQPIVVADTVGGFEEVLKRINATRGPGMTKVRPSLPADYFFGLSCPSVMKVLEALPGARTLRNYKFQYDMKIRLPVKLIRVVDSPHLPDNFDLVLPENKGGCARAEPWTLLSGGQKYKYLDAFSHHPVSFALEDPPPPPQPLALTKTPSTVQAAELNRALSIQIAFRHMKQRQAQVLRVMRSKIQGWGVFAGEDIKEGDFIVEYIGELIRQKMADVREKRYDAQGIGCYMFRLDEHYIIDATRRGNVARLINHCCDPNAATKNIDHEGKKKIVVYAKRDIKRGEELTYDYMFAFEETKIPCNCGAANCRGWMN